MEEGKFSDRSIEMLAKSIYTEEIHHRLVWNAGCTCGKVGQLFILCQVCQPKYDDRIHEIKLRLREHLMQEVEGFMQALREEVKTPGGSMAGIWKIIKKQQQRYDDIRRRYNQ